jgi:hypothetical protein
MPKRLPAIRRLLCQQSGIRQVLAGQVIIFLPAPHAHLRRALLLARKVHLAHDSLNLIVGLRGRARQAGGGCEWLWRAAAAREGCVWAGGKREAVHSLLQVHRQRQRHPNPHPPRHRPNSPHPSHPPARAGPAGPEPSCCTQRSPGAGPAGSRAGRAAGGSGSGAGLETGMPGGGSMCAARGVGTHAGNRKKPRTGPGLRSRLRGHKQADCIQASSQAVRAHACWTQGCWKIFAMVMRCAGLATRIFWIGAHKSEG